MAFQPKLIRSRPPVTINRRSMKCYDITVTDEPIRGDVERAALEVLPKLVPDLDPDDGTPPSGWIILHEGGDRTAAYLNAYNWVWDNVVEFHAAASAQPHLGCPDDDPTNFAMLDRPWIGGIWELPPFGHERSASVRHISGVDHPDLDAYLADILPDGPAGQPN
jgi:hypothetical protein